MRGGGRTGGTEIEGVQMQERRRAECWGEGEWGGGDSWDSKRRKAVQQKTA